MGSAEAAGALLAWLEDRYGGPVNLVEPPTSKEEGFDNEIHLVHPTGEALPDEWRRPLVLRVNADVDGFEQARREAAIQAWVADMGYPAPRVLHVFDAAELLDRPTQVMHRAPGSLMLERFLYAPWQAGRMVRRLAALHTQLHLLPVDGFPRKEDLLDRRLLLTRRTAEALGDKGLQDGLTRVMRFADKLRDAPASPCHGDFHPLNVLVFHRSAAVIDWTDAGIGDRHGDVARTILLFELAGIAASNAVQRAAMQATGPLLARAYQRAYGRGLPLDPHRLALWRPVHLLHAWAQAVALQARLGRPQSAATDGTRRLPDGAIDELRRRFFSDID